MARQQKLNEERRRRDEQEIELAADYDLRRDDWETARAAVHAAELAMGGVVDALIGDLRIRYPRAAQLLDTPEDELKRLRQLATENTPRQPVATTRPRQRPSPSGRDKQTASAPPTARDQDPTPPPATPAAAPEATSPGSSTEKPR